MIRSYIKTAYRNMIRNKLYSLINVAGLAVGMAASFLIIEYVIFQFSFDRFHQDKERIYRVVNDRFQNGQLIQHGTITYPTIGRALNEDFPEIESNVRTVPRGRVHLKVGDQFYTEDSWMFVDPNFLTFFSFPLVAGNPSTALRDSHNLVISEQMARKLFANSGENYSEVLGRLVRIDNDPTPFEITGIIVDVPPNSHLQFDFLISYNTYIDWVGEQADNSWVWSDMWHYIKLKPGVSPESVESKLMDFSSRHFKGTEVSGAEEVFSLQPLLAAHLFSDFEYEIAEVENGEAVLAMLAIAIFILIIAWINYINLATARSMERAREVGIRKVMGAISKQLTAQFLFESTLVHLIGLVLAVALIEFFQGGFNQLIGDDLSLTLLFGSEPGAGFIPLAVLALLLFGIVVSGLYPAVVISSFRPIQTLKGRFSSSRHGLTLRKALVVFQFLAAITLISGTYTVYRQIKFMDSQDLGVDIDNTMVVWGPNLTNWDSTFIPKVISLKTELERQPRILGVTTSERLPGHRLGRMFGIRVGKDTLDQQFSSSYMSVSHEFIDQFGIGLVAGRNFRPSDHNYDWNQVDAAIINESAVRLFGFDGPADALDQEIAFFGKSNRVVGVVNDFHHHSLKLRMEPIVFQPTYGNYQYFSIKMDPDELAQSIDYVREQFLSVFPNNTFEYFFLEDFFDQQYHGDRQFGKIATLFTLLGILIASLGLFGLVSYSAIQRTKEIGIRKVLGASIVQLLSVLIRDFVRLIALAFALGAPLSYFFMERWLSDYAYRIPITWELLVLPCLSVLFLALVTMSFQTYRTAQANPVDSLRYE